MSLVCESIALKAFIAICAVSALLLIGLPIAGFFYKDVFGYFIFSLLPIAILTDFLVLLSYIAKKKTVEISRTIWVILHFIVLFSIIATSQSELGNIVIEVGIYIIGLTTFPIGVIAFLLLASVLFLFDSIRPFFEILTPFESLISYVIIVFLRAFFFILGYLQWFKLFPFLIDKIWLVRSR